MLKNYVHRPTTIRAIRVTEDNWQEVAAWLRDHVAANGEVRKVDPGHGRAPYLYFVTASHLGEWRSGVRVDIPGVVTMEDNPHGQLWQGGMLEHFDARWEARTEAQTETTKFPYTYTYTDPDGDTIRVHGGALTVNYGSGGQRTAYLPTGNAAVELARAVLDAPGDTGHIVISKKELAEGLLAATRAHAQPTEAK